jgi:hypothetical protein
MNVYEFQPGDLVKFCGDEATVLSNYGDRGVVRLGSGQGTCRWHWSIFGESVKLVRKGDASVRTGVPRDTEVRVVEE